MAALKDGKSKKLLEFVNDTLYNYMFWRMLTQ